MTPARKRALLLLLLLVAVVLPRLGAASISTDRYFARGDRNWDHLARNLLEGDGLLIPHVGAMKRPQYAHKTPVFALLLAGIYKTVGREPWAIVAMQILFALAATWLVFLLTTRLTGQRTAGWIAAFITALYPPLVVHDVQLMETTLYRGLVALLTLLVYEAGVAPRARTLLLTGLVAGVTVLTRTTIVFFLPLAALWLLVAWGREIPRLVPAVVGAIVIFLVVLSPWFIRNWDLFEQPHLITGGGRSYWIATSEPFLDTFPERSVDRAEFEIWDLIPKAERDRLKTVSEIDLDAELRKRAAEDLDRHPDRMAKLLAVKAAAAFSPVLNPHDERDQFDQTWGARKKLVHIVSYLPLLVFGAFGLLHLLLRKFPAGSLLLLQFLAFLAFSLMFWAHSRHRYFLDEFLAVAAASLFVSLAWRGRGPEGDKAGTAPTGLPGRDEHEVGP